MLVLLDRLRINLFLRGSLFAGAFFAAGLSAAAFAGAAFFAAAGFSTAAWRRRIGLLRGLASWPERRPYASFLPHFRRAFCHGRGRSPPWTWLKSSSARSPLPVRGGFAVADSAFRTGNRRPCPHTAGRGAALRRARPAGHIRRSAGGLGRYRCAACITNRCISCCETCAMRLADFDSNRPRRRGAPRSRDNRRDPFPARPWPPGSSSFSTSCSSCCQIWLNPASTIVGGTEACAAASWSSSLRFI